MELQELTDKTVLVTMVFQDAEGQTVEQRQVFGRVFDTGPQGILLFLEPSGNEFALPPNTRNLTPADAGEYRLEPDGQVVTNPDYLATWTVRRRD